MKSIQVSRRSVRMFHNHEAESYEPTFGQHEEIRMELLPQDADSAKNGTRIVMKKTTANGVEFELSFSRNSSGLYDACIRCMPKRSDPHWSLKIRIGHQAIIEGRKVCGIQFVEVNVGKAYHTIASFESVPDNSTYAALIIAITILKSEGIHMPMKFDFAKKTKLSDITLIVEGRKLYVTKSIIAMQSAYFKRKFDEDNHDEFKLHDVKYEDMELFITLIYPHTTHDQIPALLNDMDQIDRLVQLSRRFECPSITSIIERALLKRASKNNEMLLFSDKHALSKLCSRQLKRLQTRDDFKALEPKSDSPKLSDELRSHLLESVLEKLVTAPKRPQTQPAVSTQTIVPGSAAHATLLLAHLHQHQQQQMQQMQQHRNQQQQLLQQHRFHQQQLQLNLQRNQQMQQNQQQQQNMQQLPPPAPAIVVPPPLPQLPPPVIAPPQFNNQHVVVAPTPVYRPVASYSSQLGHNFNTAATQNGAGSSSSAVAAGPSTSSTAAGPSTSGPPEKRVKIPQPSP